MSEKSAIEWTDSTWNPLRGQNARHTCARISPGCDNCYAATMTRRGLMGTAPIDYGTGETPNDPSRLDLEALRQPLRWKKPRKVFVCSMTDLFGAWVPEAWIAAIFAVMENAPQHTYIVLTKRPSRMRFVLSRGFYAGAVRKYGIDVLGSEYRGYNVGWPMPHVWIGVTIESDAYAWRADRLRDTIAAVRWVSAEPLLSSLPSLNLDGIDWLVTGGESGHGARPCHPDWVRDLRDRCRTADVAFFHKQWGEFCHPTQLPDDVDGSGSFIDDLLRVGRRKTGRLLDGVEWSQFPAPRAAGATP